MRTTHRPTDDARDEILRLMRELEALRSTIQVQMHLAGMELRDRWSRFERRHVKLRAAVCHARDGALGALRAAMNEHRMALHDLHDDLAGDPEP